MTDEFRVGETYENRRGPYKVLARDGHRLEVEYFDGEHARLDAETQATIIANMRSELARLAGDIAGAQQQIQQQFYWTMGFLALQGDLQAEVPAQAEAGFKQRYRQITGDPITDPTPGYYRLHGVPDKWGAELRIYFFASPSELERFTFGRYIDVRLGTTADQYRINNNELFYRLLGFGFRLGSKQDTAKIRSHIPASMRDAFDEGASR